MIIVYYIVVIVILPFLISNPLLDYDYFIKIFIFSINIMIVVSSLFYCSFDIS